MPNLLNRSLLLAVIFIPLFQPDVAISQTEEERAWCLANTQVRPTFDQQIRGCTALLNSGTLDNKDRARVLFFRSVVYIVTNDFGAALADLDAAAGIVPNLGVQFRGRVNYTFAKFDSSAADLAIALATDLYFDDRSLPRDVYLARARSGHSNAENEYTATMKQLLLANKIKVSDYKYIEYEFFLGHQTMEALFVAAGDKCDAQYSVAQRSLLRGDRQRAVDELKITVDVCQNRDWPLWTARAELKRLGQQ